MTLLQDDETPKGESSVSGLSWRDFFERLGNGTLIGPGAPRNNGATGDALPTAERCPADSDFR